MVKSPTMTPRKMAANRANASKSTGPRTAEGRRRVMLNSLRHGGRSGAFRANLIKAGQGVELFDWIQQRVREEMLQANRRLAEHLARRVWCALRLRRKAGQRPQEPPPTQASLWCAAWTPWRAGGLAAEPRYVVKSTDAQVTFPLPRSRIRIEDPSSQRRLMFWVRGRRGTKVRLPVTAWPEIAAGVMGLRPGLQAGAQPTKKHPTRTLRLRQSNAHFSPAASRGERAGFQPRRKAAVRPNSPSRAGQFVSTNCPARESPGTLAAPRNGGVETRLKPRPSRMTREKSRLG